MAESEPPGTYVHRDGTRNIPRMISYRMEVATSVPHYTSTAQWTIMSAVLWSGDESGEKRKRMEVDPDHTYCAVLVKASRRLETR